MRVSLYSAAGIAGMILAACAPAADAPAPAPETPVAAEIQAGEEAAGPEDETGGEADAQVDRGEIAGSLALLEGTVFVPPEGRDVTAGFGTFAAGTRAVTITGAQAAFAQAVELHTHEMSEDGRMAMRKVDAFAVPANEDRVLKRGGDHMMFFGVQPGSLTPGASVTVTVSIQHEDGTTGEIEMPFTVETLD